jgi:hypothetical protein
MAFEKAKVEKNPVYKAPKSIDLSSVPGHVSQNSNWIDAFAKSNLSGKAAKKKATNPALWKQMLGSLTGLGSMVTDTVYNKAGSAKDIFQGKGSVNDFARFLDPTFGLGEQAYKGVSNQIKQWTTGGRGIQYNDIPLLGSLNLISQNSKHGADILKDQFGVKNEAAQRWGGLGIDILADPLTWVTGGSTGAMKSAGQAAALAAAKDAGIAVTKTSGKALGFIPKKAWDVSKIAEQVGEGVATRTEKALPNFGNNASDAYRAGTQKVLDAARKNSSQKVLDAVDAARGSKQNALFSVGVPFGKKVAVGQKPDWLRKLARTTTRPIGGVGGAQVVSTLEHLGMNAQDQATFLKSVYGVDSAEQLTEEAFKNFSRNTAKHVDAAGEQVNWSPKGVDPNVNLGAAPHMTPGMNIPTTQGSSNMLQTLLKSSPKYTQGEVARRSILPSVFNPRTLGTGTHYVDSSANAMRDAETQILGRSNQLNSERKAIDQFVKKNKVSDNELREVQHLLEGGKLPVGFAGSTDPARQQVVQELSGMFGKILDRTGQQGLESGVLDKLRKDYFPHVMNQNITPGAKKSALSGLSGVSGFNKEREGFDTLADLDNYVNGTRAKANKAEAAGDLDKATALREDADEIANLFERDTIEAVFKRASEGVRKSAMKALSTSLKDKGLIRLQAQNSARHHNAAEYTTLSEKQAEALGLDAGDSIHSDVLKGLEKVDEIFTFDGINKVMDGMQAVTNIWKSLVTTAVPSHFWNNFVGNIFNNALAGVRMRDYTASMELIKGFKKGTLDPRATKLMQEAIDHGAFGQGFTADFKRFVTENSKGGKLVATEKATRAFMEKTLWAKAGLYGENVTRLANFLHGKATTGSAEKAAQQVRQYLFSYQEMTKGDKVARLAVPFWNWTKNNLPLQFEQFFKNTRVYQNFDRIKREWDEATGAENPEWGADRYWKIPGTNVGLPLNLPLSDLDYGQPNQLDTVRKLMSNMTPLAKIPTELSLNKQFYTNKPVDWDATQNGGTVGTQEALQYMLKQTGGIAKLVQLLGSSGGKDTGTDIIGALIGRPFDYKTQE